MTFYQKVINFSFYTLLTTVFLLITSCSEDNPPVINDLEDETIAGEYKGRWISTATRADFNVGISSDISESGDNYFSGAFYISNNFTPCCGPDNDGTIVFNIDGDSILNFTYFDVIPGCNGTFNGSGIIDESGSLLIKFTGTDCDGDHIGTISLSK